jgi:Glycosyltransferase family 20
MDYCELVACISSTGPTFVNVVYRLSHAVNVVKLQVQDVEALFFNQFCQGVLWPLFHCIPTNFNEGLLDNFLGQYEAYAHANRAFLDAVAEVYEEGDLVRYVAEQLQNLLLLKASLLCVALHAVASCYL